MFLISTVAKLEEDRNQTSQETSQEITTVETDMVLFETGMDVDNDQKRAAEDAPADVKIEQDDDILMEGQAGIWDCGNNEE